MERIKPQEQQNIFDIAIQAYGSIEGVFDLMEDNSFDVLPEDLSVYEELDITKQPIRQDIRNFYDERNIKPASGITQSQLDLLKLPELDQGEGIGVMMIGDDFIVAPSEEVEVNTLDGIAAFNNPAFSEVPLTNNQREKVLNSIYYSTIENEGQVIKKIEFGEGVNKRGKIIYPFLIEIKPDTLYNVFQSLEDSGVIPVGILIESRRDGGNFNSSDFINKKPLQIILQQQA